MSCFLSSPAGVGPAYLVAPDIVHVPEICCVGLNAQTSLPVKNPSARWLSVEIRLVRLLIGQNECSSVALFPFIFKEKVVIEPNTMENIKVCCTV